MDTFTSPITQRGSAILKICSEIESRKYFAIKATISHYVVAIFTNRAPLMMNSCTVMSLLTSNMCYSF